MFGIASVHGAAVILPSDTPLEKYSTLTTVPSGSDTFAPRKRLAGATTGPWLARVSKIVGG